MIICRILACVTVNVKKACKIDEYLDIKNCQCKKRLIDKIALACEDKILNTTEASLDDKKSNIALFTLCHWLLCYY